MLKAGYSPTYKVILRQAQSGVIYFSVKDGEPISAFGKNESGNHKNHHKSTTAKSDSVRQFYHWQRPTENKYGAAIEGRRNRF